MPEKDQKTDPSTAGSVDAARPEQPQQGSTPRDSGSGVRKVNLRDMPPAQADEVGGPRGPEPTRYGDWERKGRVSDF